MEPCAKYLEKELPLLENLRPYPGGSRKYNTPREYIENYFYGTEQIRTYTRSGFLQCRSSKRRSFTDVYYITLAKFPGISQEEVAYILLSNIILEGESKDMIYLSYCNVVKKVVFHKVWYNNNPYIRKAAGLFQDTGYAGSYMAFDGRNFPVDSITVSMICDLANKYINDNNLKI